MTMMTAKTPPTTTKSGIPTADMDLIREIASFTSTNLMRRLLASDDHALIMTITSMIVGDGWSVSMERNFHTTTGWVQTWTGLKDGELTYAPTFGRLMDVVQGSSEAQG